MVSGSLGLPGCEGNVRRRSRLQRNENVSLVSPPRSRWPGTSSVTIFSNYIGIVYLSATASVSASAGL